MKGEIMTKSYMIIKPEILDQAQKIVNLKPEFDQREKEIRGRFDKEMEELSNEFNARKDILWDKLIDQIGLTSRNENGDQMPYTIDNSYFEEHSVVFVVFEDEAKVCDCPGCRSMRESGEVPMSLADILGFGKVN
jgi:hypothetical protein